MAEERERAKFRHPGRTPPIGYVYEIAYEDTTFSFQAPTRLGILQKIRAWYASKDITWPGDKEIESRMEDYVCRLLPQGFCKGSDGKGVPYLSVAKIRDATRLFFGRVSKGKSALVSADVANNRARICANCPKNLHGICTSCAGSEFMDIFGWFVRQGRSTPLDAHLDTCSECGCLLRAKVHISTEELEKLEPHTYPDNCWLRDTKCYKPPSPTQKEDDEIRPYPP